MKKIVLSLVACSSLLLASSTKEIQDEILNVEAQIKKLNNSLVSLKDELKAKAKPVVKLEKKKSEFITHTALGYTQTRGNTKTKTYNVDAEIKKNWDKHILEFNIDAQYADDDGQETKNKFLAELSYDYDFCSNISMSYLLGYKIDRFSGFDSQLYTGPGLKYKAIKTDKHTLNFGGNVLYSVDEIEDTYVDFAGNNVSYPYPSGSISQNNSYTDSYTSLRAKAAYSWQVLENLKFNQELTYRASIEEFQNYFMYSKTGLSSKINSIFSAGISYKLDYINEPAEGKNSTDKTFSVNLIMDY